MSHPVEQLTAYLDGALAPGERDEVAAHLAGCAACRAEHDRLAAALRLLARLPAAPEPSPTFDQRFLARLARERSGAGTRRAGLAGRRGWRWLAPALAGAAAAAVVVYAGARHRADERFIAEHLDLFENYELVASVGAVDTPADVEVVAHLDELGEGRP